MEQVGQSVLDPLQEELMADLPAPKGIGMDVDYYRKGTHPVFY